MDHELRIWLGPAYDDLTDHQRDRISREADAIHDTYPDPDDQDLRDAALSAAVQYLLGETTPDDAAAALAAARLRQLHATAAAKQIAAMRADDGIPVAEAARNLGITRRTLILTLKERNQ